MCPSLGEAKKYLLVWMEGSGLQGPEGLKFGSCECRFSFCGSVRYIAPEVLEVSDPEHLDGFEVPPLAVPSQGYDCRVDTWSMGVLLYQLLCGKAPFEGYPASEIFEAIYTVNLEFPQQPAISKAARELIRKVSPPYPSYCPVSDLSLLECFRPFVGHKMCIEPAFATPEQRRLPRTVLKRMLCDWVSFSM